MSILRYGIIGSGMMGREHIQNLQLLKDTSITAIWEPNGGTAAFVLLKWWLMPKFIVL